MPAFTIIIEDELEGPAVTVEQSHKLEPGQPQTPARLLFNFIMGALSRRSSLQPRDAGVPRLYNAEGDEVDIRRMNHGG